MRFFKNEMEVIIGIDRTKELTSQFDVKLFKDFHTAIEYYKSIYDENAIIKQARVNKWYIVDSEDTGYHYAELCKKILISDDF